MPIIIFSGKGACELEGTEEEILIIARLFFKPSLANFLFHRNSTGSSFL
jgi:hypothetical protein